jgi:hypothetical protein
MISKRYLGKSINDWNNEKRLPIINLIEAQSFWARMQLVVATRLHMQYSPFRLCTSNNTPSIPLNDAHGPFRRFRKEMHFLFCNFHLKKHMDELAQIKTRLSVGRAQQLVTINLQLIFTSKKRDHKKTC